MEQTMIVRKRKNNTASQELSEYYDVTVNPALIKAETERREERVRQVVTLSVVFHHNGYLNGHVELQRSVIIGAQSSGKSTLFNALISAMTEEETEIAPSAAELCTTRPLDVSLCPSEGPRFDLVIPNFSKKTTEDDAVIREAIRKYYGLFGTAVDFAIDGACKLNIRAKDTYRLVDTPGPTLTSGSFSEYFAKITSAGTNGAPVLILATNAIKNSCDPASETLLSNLISAIREKPADWNGASLFIVVTGVDLAIQQGHTDLLRSNCIKLHKIFQEMNIPGLRIVVALTQLVAGDLKTRREIRETEEKTLKSTSFSDVPSDSDGNPIWLLGISELKEALVVHLRSSVIRDGAYLSSFEGALNKRLEYISTQLGIVRDSKSMSGVAADIVARFNDFGEQSQAKVNCSSTARYVLRELCEERYAAEWKDRNLDPDTDSDAFNEAEIPKGVPAAEADKIWREVTIDLLAHMAKNTERIVKPTLYEFSEKVRSFFEPYNDFEEVHATLMKTYYEFREKEVKEFQDQVRKMISKQTFFIEQRQEENVQVLAASWPKNSTFIADAHLGSKKPLLVRRILKTLVPTLSHLVNNIVVERFVFEERFCQMMRDRLFSMTDVIKDLSKEKHLELERTRDQYHLALRYVKTFLREIPRPEEAAKELSKEETEEERESKKAKTLRETAVEAITGLFSR